MLPRRLFSSVHPVFAGGDLARVVKSVPRRSAVSPEAVLVYPGEDLQGDIVEPDGGDWTPFQDGGCLVNFEHGPHVGYGEVVLKSIDVEGERVNVPVGTTRFFQSAADLRGQPLPRYDARGNVVGSYAADECLRTAEQIAPLVADGTLNGVSIEFRPAGPKGQAFEEIGPSPLLDRPACHFKEWHGLGWAAACEMPVNPNARYILTDATKARAEKAFRLVHESPGTLEFVRKSLAPLAALARDPHRVTVAMSQHNKGLFGGTAKRVAGKKKSKLGTALRVAGGLALGGAAVAGGLALGGAARRGAANATRMGTPGNGGTFGQRDANRNSDRVMAAQRKGIDPDEQHPESDEHTEHGGEGDHHDALPDGMTHTPATCYQLSQSVLDVTGMGEELLAHSEHPEAKAKVGEILAQLKTLAEQLKALGDDTHAEISGGGGGDTPPDPEPLKTDDTGAIESKSFGPHWRPVRLTAADLGPPVSKKGRHAPAEEEGLSLDEQRSLLAEVKRLRGR